MRRILNAISERSGFMYIVYALVLFLILVGIVECVAWAKYFLLKPEQKVSAQLVLPVSGHVENIEQLLRYYKHRLEWDLPSVGIDKLVIADEGMDEVTCDICRKFCEKNDCICLFNLKKIHRDT